METKSDVNSALAVKRRTEKFGKALGHKRFEEIEVANKRANSLLGPYAYQVGQIVNYESRSEQGVVDWQILDARIKAEDPNGDVEVLLWRDGGNKWIKAKLLHNYNG